jgi:hypothetical protein
LDNYEDSFSFVWPVQIFSYLSSDINQNINGSLLIILYLINLFSFINVIYSTDPLFSRITYKNIRLILHSMSLHILPLITKVRTMPISSVYLNHLGTIVLTHKYFEILKIFQKRNFYTPVMSCLCCRVDVLGQEDRGGRGTLQQISDLIFLNII